MLLVGRSGHGDRRRPTTRSGGGGRFTRMPLHTRMRACIGRHRPCSFVRVRCCVRCGVSVVCVSSACRLLVSGRLQQRRRQRRPRADRLEAGRTETPPRRGGGWSASACLPACIPWSRVVSPVVVSCGARRVGSGRSPACLAGGSGRRRVFRALGICDCGAVATCMDRHVPACR